MPADVVGGDVWVKLADGRKYDVAHDGVAELFGEDSEAGGVVGVVGLGDDLGEDLAAEVGDVRCLPTSVVACNGLAADDVEDAFGDGVAAAEWVETGVLMEEAGKEPGGEVGAVGFVDEAAPGVGVEAGDALAEGGVLVEAFGGDGGEAEEEEGGVVECLVGGDVEVVLPAGGRGAGACGDGAEVGHEAEDAGGLLTFEGDGVSVRVLRNGSGGIARRGGMEHVEILGGRCGVGVAGGRGGGIGERGRGRGGFGGSRRSDDEGGYGGGRVREGERLGAATVVDET